MEANRERKLRLCGKLFVSFLKIGPTTFGGGYAILPVIDKEVTERRGWLGSKEMSEMTALSGAAPGGIGVNVAALVGYRVAKHSRPPCRRCRHFPADDPYHARLMRSCGGLQP